MTDESNIQTFENLVDLVLKIYDSKADDKTKYECIFSDSVYKQIISLGFLIGYEDPNGTYIEDIQAFITAITTVLNKINKIKFKII